MSGTNDAPVVATASGVLRGSREGGVHVFRGVPYGTAPARWAPGSSMPPWDGVRDATLDGPVCPQPRRGPVVDLIGDQISARREDEDCLSLTIWAPAADDGRRPVLVWIHGGGFIGGASSWDIYSLARVAEHGDVVVVSMNYRLGPFGYLHVGEEDAAGGNAWLADQRLALDWIVNSVAAFGGDPERITLGGQSGGAYSTVALMGLPEPPPVRRAVLLSAPLGIRARSVAESTAFTRDYQQMLGASSVAELRAMEPSELLAVAPALFQRLASYGAVKPPFMPTVDEPLVPHDVAPRFVQRAADFEVFIGWTAKEMGFWLPLDPSVPTTGRERVVERMRSTFGDRADEAYETYAAAGAGSPVDVLFEYTSDELFRMPALDLARRVVASGGRAWSYQFDAHSDAFGGLAGACHCVDIPFFLDQLETWQAAGGSLLAGMDIERHQPLADEAHRALIAFVRGEAPWSSRGTDVHEFSLVPTDGPAVPEPLVELWRD